MQVIKYMSKNNKNEIYITMTISCKECRGTGFIELSKEEQCKRVYCQTCTGIQRCYLCENKQRLGRYAYCKKCYGQGYTEKKVKKSK